mmetsp:Transcript_11169/g.25609  ORF Transcript_11169/g.25609 Transcript_11169/m.25609 type:complete len:261 (-) Transcript_11169:210-992(-)
MEVFIGTLERLHHFVHAQAPPARRARRRVGDEERSASFVEDHIKHLLLTWNLHSECEDPGRNRTSWSSDCLHCKVPNLPCNSAPSGALALLALLELQQPHRPKQPVEGVVVEEVRYLHLKSLHHLLRNSARLEPPQTSLAETTLRAIQSLRKIWVAELPGSSPVADAHAGAQEASLDQLRHCFPHPFLVGIVVKDKNFGLLEEAHRVERIHEDLLVVMVPINHDNLDVGVGTESCPVLLPSVELEVHHVAAALIPAGAVL